MSDGDGRLADGGSYRRRNAARVARTALSERRRTERASTRRESDQQPFVEMARAVERTLATGAGGDLVTEDLLADNPGASALLYRRDSDLKLPRRPIPLHSPDGNLAVGLGGEESRFRTVRKCSARPLLGQTETDGGAFHGLAGFIRHLHSDSASAPAPDRVDCAISIDDAQL